jgi:hypothetical protein
MYSKNKNVTMIDDLLDLDDTSSNASDNKYSKFIRNSGNQIDPDSGMNPYNTSPSHINQQQPQQYFQPQKIISKPVENDIINTPNCLDIHNHVTQCPICSKFFKFDNSVYIISIIVLSIICILLLKKVLNV